FNRFNNLLFGSLQSQQMNGLPFKHSTTRQLTGRVTFTPANHASTARTTRASFCLENFVRLDGIERCSRDRKTRFAPGTTDVGERFGCVAIKCEPRWGGDSSDKDGSDDRQLEKQQWKNKHQCRFCPYSSSY
ncbi:unnamed protein product, partial [Ixodes persulcatus]